MPKPDHYTSETKHQLIPPRMRFDDMAPLYELNAPDYDRVPVRTYLITAAPGTEGRFLMTASVVVMPREPGKYPVLIKTKAGRVVVRFWSNGMAVRALQRPTRDIFRHMVFPGEPGYDMLCGFDTACDIRRRVAGRPQSMRPTLLYQALGLDMPV